MQHGVSWLHQPIVFAFRYIHDRTRNEPGTGIRTSIIEEHTDDDGDSDSDGSSPPSPPKLQCVGNCPVRLYSVEVWNAKTGALAAGELGYAIGSVYTSLTGFTAEDSAGSVQLAALGRFLTQESFDMWDLGMELDYKTSLGARNLDRVQFVETLKRLRVKNPNGRLKCDERVSCKDIITAK